MRLLFAPDEKHGQRGAYYYDVTNDAEEDGNLAQYQNSHQGREYDLHIVKDRDVLCGSVCVGGCDGELSAGGRKACQKQGRHKKQTGGHGQFGDVWIQFEPIPGEDVEFAENVFGGSVPKNFFPAVEKGVRQAAQHGVLAGYPMVGLKATLLDGSYHPVDSSEMAFIMAAKLSYRPLMTTYLL